MQEKRLFWTCPHCGREVVWESGPYILQNGTQFFCPYCDGSTIITLQKYQAAEHHMHPTSGERAVNGALSAPESQPSNVADSTPPTRGQCNPLGNYESS
jgi:predicted RNA-binding Zn-ribbon protein involved in translation (DUF1610 family)